MDLSDKELRLRLIQLGASPGPITDTTRNVYVKTLQKLQDKQRAELRETRRSASVRSSRGRSPSRVDSYPPAARSDHVTGVWRGASCSDTGTGSARTPPHCRTNGADTVPSPIGRAAGGSVAGRRVGITGSRLNGDGSGDNTGEMYISTPVTDGGERAAASLLARQSAVLSSGAGGGSGGRSESDDELDAWIASPTAQLHRYRSRVRAARGPHMTSTGGADGFVDRTLRSFCAGLVPLLLVAAALLFLAVLATSYLQLRRPSPPLPSNSLQSRVEVTPPPPPQVTTVFPICGGGSINVRLGCVREERLMRATAALHCVHSTVYRVAREVACGQSQLVSAHISLQQLATELSDTGCADSGAEAIDEAVLRDLAVLVAYNGHWGLGTDMGVDLELRSQPIHVWPTEFTVPWWCLLKSALYWCLSAVVYTGGVLLCAVAVFYACRLYRRRQQHERQAVLRMAERIIEHVAAGAETGAPVAISHVRDQIVPLALRSDARQLRLWRRALQLVLRTESRVREETAPVHGEPHTVLRWLSAPPAPTPARPAAAAASATPATSAPRTAHRRRAGRVWLDRAFEAENGLNVPLHARTDCLKVRNMFDLQQLRDSDGTPAGDWRAEVRDALLDKCAAAAIVHLVLDERSSDGLVYVRCASRDDALCAFRALQGCWFDGRLVSVKFIKTERYGERFGAQALRACTRLQPSSNMRRSMACLY